MNTDRSALAFLREMPGELAKNAARLLGLLHSHRAQRTVARVLSIVWKAHGEASAGALFLKLSAALAAPVSRERARIDMSHRDFKERERNHVIKK